MHIKTIVAFKTRKNTEKAVVKKLLHTCKNG